MSEMVERVARAIAVNNDGHWTDMARAAIAAMHDPTQEMIEAGQSAPMWKPSPVSEIFQAMIDAALADERID